MRFSKVMLLMTCVLILGVLAHSQIRESGAIQGNATDKTGAPLPGVTITLTGTSLIGGARTFLTDSKGFYRFPSIPPGPYVVSAELTGFVKLVKEKIQLHAGVTLTVDFVMEEAKIEKEVLVTAVSPTVDLTSSTTAPVVMSDDLLLATPAINSPDSGAKSFYDILNLAPGVDYYQAYGSGFGSPNNYQMDGINTLGIIEPDYNIISEATVQSFGLPAEYGDFTGVVFNAVTKSGSNKYSALAEFRYNGKNWSSQNITGVPTDQLFDPTMKDSKQFTDQHLDLGFQLGGPILKDKLWFFVSGEYYQTIKNPPGTPVQPKWYSPKFFGKLSLQVNPSNRVNLGVNYDNEKANTIVAGPQFPADVSLDNNYPGYVINLNWTSIFSPNTFLDMKLGFNHKDRDQLPTAGMDISGHLDLATGMWSKNYPGFYQGRNRYLDLNAHLSHYVPEFIKGSHDLKLGIEYRYAKEATGGGYAGPDHTFYEDMNGQPFLAIQYENNYFLDVYYRVC